MQHVTLGDVITSTEPNLPYTTGQDSNTTEQTGAMEEDLTMDSIQDSQQGIRLEGHISIAMGVLVLVPILIAIIVVVAGVLFRLYNKTQRKKGDK